MNSLLSGSSIETFMKIAETLVGHRTNSIVKALEIHQVNADPELLRLDLKRIGIIQCEGCSLWWWKDQTTNGYCHSLCGSENVRNNKEPAIHFGGERAFSRKQVISAIL